MYSFVRPIYTTFCAVVLHLGTSPLFADEVSSFPKVISVEENSNQEQNNESARDTSSFFLQDIGSVVAADFYQKIHADAYNSIVGTSAAHDVILLKDSSRWDVASSYRRIVGTWAQEDNIFIKPSVSWFSGKNYVLHNMTTNEVAEVSLRERPAVHGAYTFFIVNIEPNNRQVLLNDNTVWQIDLHDFNFSQWRVGQRVMIGVNNNWRTSPLPQIFINVDLNQDLRILPYAQAKYLGTGA